MAEENKNNEIQRFQENLKTLRSIAGWTAEELGDRIGVTKQTISNLENYKRDDYRALGFKSKMTKTQYIALRAAFDVEIQRVQNEGNDNEKERFGFLKKALEELIDNPSDDKEKAEKYSALAAILGTTGAVTTAVAKGLGIAALPLVGAAVAAGLPLWTRILGSCSKKKKK